LCCIYEVGEIQTKGKYETFKQSSFIIPALLGRILIWSATSAALTASFLIKSVYVHFDYLPLFCIHSVLEPNKRGISGFYAAYKLVNR
jgi:hypothetical protein